MSILNATTTSGVVLTGDTTGNLVIQSAGVNVATFSSSGLSFAANPGGGTSGALNDYEVGTYTVTMTPAGGSFTMDTARDTFQYVKVGRMVTVMGYTRPATVSSPTGTITINLPFAAAAGTQFSGYTAGVVIPENLVSGSSNGFGLIVSPSGSTATISYTAGGGSAANWQVCAEKFQANTNITVSLTYE